MRKVYLLIMSMIPILLLIACGIKTLEFSGESSNWSIAYQVEVISEDSQSENLTIKYIGEKPVPKNIDYEIVNEKEVNDISLKNGIFKGGRSSCSGCSITSESQEFEAIVEWNGNSERMTLKNK